METNSIADLNRNEYEGILNIPMHLVVILSHKGNILKTNITQGRILGWDPNEIIEKPFKYLIHENDQELANKKMALLISGQEPSVTLSTRCWHKDGSWRWISWTAISKDNSVYAIGTDTTKVVEIERNHKELQTRYAAFFEQSTLPMGIYSLDGLPLVLNKAWEDIFESGLERFWSFVERVKQDNVQVEVPAFLYKTRWLEAGISSVKDDCNIIQGIAIILKDVTEKIETQKALIESISEQKSTEEKFQIISDRLGMAVKAGNIGIWEWIPNTNHVIFDETTEEIYGYGPGTFSKTSDELNERIYPEDRTYLWSTIALALKERKSYRIDHRIIRKDGVKCWVQELGMALYDEQGKPYHMMGTVMDITDRIESETDQKFLSQASELLNESLDYKELLKTLGSHAIEYFCDGVYIDQLLPDGSLKRLIVIHPESETVNKITKIEEEFPNRFENHPIMNSLITGKSLFAEDVDKFVRQSLSFHGEKYLNALADLSIKSSISVRLKGRESILGMITFFTMKNSQKDLKKKHIWLAEELACRASMAFENALIHLSSQEAIRSRDEFLSIASHELKTPLQSLTLQNQMRKRNLDKKIVDSFTPEKVGTMIEADLRHLMRINRLIDDMLDISHIRSGKLTLIKEKIEFCSFVKDVVERFRPQIESVGCYMTAVYTDPLIGYLDIYRIEQVIVNLLTNAKKYGAGTPIKIEVCKKMNTVQLLVHDKGPGIKEQDTERIFERFERAISSNEVSGLGLGLYISRKIMEQNDGKLYVQSVPGKGSTFIMEFPMNAEQNI